MLFNTYAEDNNQAISLLSNGEVWLRNDRTGAIVEYCKRILSRLVEEGILDKSEKNLASSKWSIRNVYFSNPKNDPNISNQLKRFVEICEEELDR